ncbi:MAG: hypothetical protein KC493_03120, partial [Bacteriovoracaceae bacterium]|nr:hypothetical protein [Bacteriovoracaceae bacterium]
MFASYTAERITEYISKKTKLSVNFERIEFQLYPIGSILKSVEITSREKEGLRNLYASEVGIYFDFLDFFSNKISVKRVSIVSAEAEFLNSQKDTKKSEKKIDFENTVKEIKKGMSEVNHEKITKWMKKNLPIELESLHFEDSVVRIGPKKYQLSNAEISIFNKTTELKGSIESASLDFLEIPNIKSVDSVEFDIQLSENDYRIRKVKISEGLSTLNISGKLQNKENIPIDLEVEAISSLKRVSELISISEEMGPLIEGLVSISGKITGSAIEPVTKIDIKTAGIKSKFFRLREGDIKLKIDKGNVSLESLSLAQGIGWIKNKEAVSLYNIKKNKILIKDITVQLNEMHTNDVLYFLNDELETFKGLFSGLVTVSFLNGINEIKFRPHKGFSLEKFRLVLPDKQDENILINKGITFRNGDLVLKNLSDLYMGVSIEMKKSVIHAEGLISGSGIDLQVKDSFIDLEEFGPISGTLLKGSGKILSRISGPYENVRFDFYPDLKDFEVIDLKLGDLSGKVSLALKTLDLKLKNIKAKYKSTIYSGGGWLNFDKKEGMDININIHKGFYSDTLEMLDILVKKLDFKLPNAALEYKSNLKVKGPFDGDKLIVSGSVDGKELNFFLEDFNSIRGDFKYYGEGFQVTNLVLRKNNGSIRGSYSMNIKNDYIEYDATAAGMRLNDFKLFQMLKLGIDSELFGEFYGTGTPEDFSSRTHLKSLNGKIGNKKVGDSYFTVYNNGPDVFLTLNILDGVGNIESFLYLNEDKKKRSYVKGVINSQNVKQVFGLLSAHNMDDPDLSGELSSEFYAQFDFF